MKHRVAGRKLGRTSSHRKALFANITASLIKNDSITTTLPKAKELRAYADRLVTLAKDGSLHSRRLAMALVKDQEAVEKAFNTFGKRFANRNGGYTRIYKIGHRHGDAAPVAIIEYLAETALPESRPVKTVKSASAGKVAKAPKAEKVAKAAKPAKVAKPKAEAKTKAAAPKKAAAKKVTKQNTAG